MPLYEYACRACGERFEWLQPVGQGQAGVRCPGCGARRVERQLSTFATASAESGGQSAATESFGCGRPQCAGGTCAGSDADWN